jgi:alpha-glucuronidase
MIGLGPFPARAENGADGWLRYARLSPQEKLRYASLPGEVVLLGSSAAALSARDELIRGLAGMLDKDIRANATVPPAPAIIIGTSAQFRTALPTLHLPDNLGPGGFWLSEAGVRGKDDVLIAGGDGNGALYGVFALLNRIALGETISHLNVSERPYAPFRWVDQWDNLDGTIERGYAGRSIFFENGHIRLDLSRVSAYGRLLASVGVNGCNINNVNADARLLQPDFLPELVRVGSAFRPWGVRLSISVAVDSPKVVGGMDTFDPMDPRVAAWWRKEADAIYAAIPDFGGFVVKADSEGQPGPSSYGRSPADAANVIARSLQPHGGVLFYRAFVYNHHLNWSDPKSDRARAAYDIFHPLDGLFDDNVVIQIKHGPIDFQAREPASPLFGGLQRTNIAAELQVTQEYTGQQRHLCFLIPMWKDVLDFDLRVNRQSTLAKDLIAGKTFRRPLGGLVAVVNAGLDDAWLGHPLAMANLYGYGRLAWNPETTAPEIADDWTALTFGRDERVMKIVPEMLLTSWHTYESYTGPLGMQTLTDILGSHYGPGIESSENNGWGQWHRADHDGVGMDRSIASGTGFVGQYSPPVAQIYEQPSSTPDDLLLFFHHVPYSYQLHSKKTVIQHIYDSHYEGAEKAAGYVKSWQLLRGRIDEERYQETLDRLEYQAGHSIVWRDAICEYFLKLSGIPDEKSRAGHHINRVEAEAMALDGYSVVAVVPFENGSGGKAIECATVEAKVCTARFAFAGTDDFYDVSVQYFDQNRGESLFSVFVGEKLIAEWKANLQLPAAKIGGDSSTRRRISGVRLHHGDVIRIEGRPDREEHAAIDYVEIEPQTP